MHCKGATTKKKTLKIFDRKSIHHLQVKKSNLENCFPLDEVMMCDILLQEEQKMMSF